MSKNTEIRRILPPKQLWVIYDTLDGAHVFPSETKAKKQLKRWKQEACGDPFDSVWDMSEPIKYNIDK